MPRRSLALLVAIPFLIGTLAAGVLLLTRNAAAQTGAVRNVGAITITADNYEDLGFNRTRATGNIQLGRYLYIDGSDAYVEFDGSYLSGNGTIILDSAGAPASCLAAASVRAAARCARARSPRRAMCATDCAIWAAS
ncbi:MAG: hypothetical protein HC822_04015 [Oscillochloris sp.]|nr:hypothetical protein [Oscillochloris sp.]